MIDSATTATAKASYDRCCKSPDFLHTFYRNFIAGSPAAGPLFAHTDFDQQTRLLRHAIGLLLVFPTQPSNEPALLARVAERHSRRGLNIDPSLYRPFIDTLIETVKRFDPECTPAVEAAWRATVAPGVEYMKSKH